MTFDELQTKMAALIAEFEESNNNSSDSIVGCYLHLDNETIFEYNGDSFESQPFTSFTKKIVRACDTFNLHIHKFNGEPFCGEKKPEVGKVSFVYAQTLIIEGTRKASDFCSACLKISEI